MSRDFHFACRMRANIGVRTQLYQGAMGDHMVSVTHPRNLAYCSRVSFNQTEPLPMLISCSIARRPARLKSAPHICG